MKKEDIVHLTHIFKNCRLAIGFIGELTEEEFYQDEKSQYACVRCIEIIGEASKNLSELLKNSHPEVDWKGAMGMRDRLAHDYDGTDFRIVWDTVVNELPNFALKIEAIIAKNK